jgi:Fe-S cluster assembly iron-binding protein IscA
MVILNQPGGGIMVITDVAAHKIAALTVHTDAVLRIELRPGGCCGTYYQPSGSCATLTPR